MVLGKQWQTHLSKITARDDGEAMLEFNSRDCSSRNASCSPRHAAATHVSSA